MSRDPNLPASGIAADDRESIDDPSPEVNPVVVDAIGKALKAHYRAIAEIPLPDRFLVLLAELEAKEGRHGA